MGKCTYISVFPSWLLFHFSIFFPRLFLGQVQILVDNKKNLDLRNALRLAADVQPIKVDDSTIYEVGG